MLARSPNRTSIATTGLHRTPNTDHREMLCRATSSPAAGKMESTYIIRLPSGCRLDRLNGLRHHTVQAIRADALIQPGDTPTDQEDTMKNSLAVPVGLTAVGMLLFSLGCAHHGKHDRTPSWPAVDQLVAAVRPTAGNQTSGVVTFTKVPGGVKIVANIQGLNPDSMHAFHIHEFGDSRDPSGKSAGGHYNPAGHQHGRPDDMIRHAGDLGNLISDGDGKAHYERVDRQITIAGLRNPIIGRSVIIHAGKDKFIQPTGGAGSRIAIGVIGIAKPAG